MTLDVWHRMARNTVDSMHSMRTMHASELDGSSCPACCSTTYGESARQLGVQEVVGSNPAVPTMFREKPFGHRVEGLLYLNSRLFSHDEPGSNCSDPGQR